LKGISFMLFCLCLCRIEFSLPLTDAIRLRVPSCDVKDFIVLMYHTKIAFPLDMHQMQICYLRSDIDIFIKQIRSLNKYYATLVC
jgi:hypothetical protein